MSDTALEFPFAAGVDQSSRNEVSDPSAGWESLRNVRQERRGGASKRLAFTSLTKTRLDGSARSTGRRLMRSGEQTITIDDSNVLDVYSPSLDRFVSKATAPEAAYAFLDCPSIGNIGSVADVVSVGNFVVVAFQTTIVLGVASYAYACVLDAQTGAIIRGPEKLYGGIGLETVRLASYGTTCILFAPNSTDHDIHAYYIDLDTPAHINAGWSATTPATVTASTYTATGFSVASGTNSVTVAWASVVGTNRVNVQIMTKSALGASATIPTSSTTPLGDGVDLSEAGGTLWVAWEQGGMYVIGLDPTTLAVTSTALSTVPGGVFSSIHVASTGTGAVVLWQAVDRVFLREVNTVLGATTAVGPTVTAFNARIQGRPFLFANRLYAFFASSNQEEIALCEFTPTSTSMALHYLRPLCVPVVRGIYASSGRPRCRVALTGSYTLMTGFMTKATGTTLRANLVTLDFASRDRWQPTEHHDAISLGGGLTAMFDGDRIFEHNFLCAPPAPTVNVATAGSSTLTVGRRYVAVYVETDATGARHISGVSNPSASTGPITSKKIQVSVQPLSITARNSSRDATGTGLQIMLFATTDGGEAPYHWIDSVVNDPTTIPTFVDANSDVTILGGELLYGSGNLPGTVVGGQPGGPQDHRAPPGLRFPKSYNGMLIGASGSDLWFSGQPISGEGTWFSPLFSVPFEAPITALEVMDGSVIVWTKRGIFVVSGEPPNDAGTQGGLGSPRKLSVEVGSIDGVTLLTPAGVFFRSDRGLELLDRGLAVQYVAEIQDELAACPVVTAMVLDTRNSIVRISLAEQLAGTQIVSDAGTGRDLIYDLTAKVWSVDTKKATAVDDANVKVPQASQDAAMIVHEGESRYAWLAADGTVYVERLKSDASAYLDGALWVDMLAESRWVHVAAIQGEQFLDQLIMLMQRHTDHGLRVSFAFDYVESFTSSRTYTPAEVAALSREWLSREITQTQSTSIKVRIEDVEPDAGLYTLGNGRGATWIALTFGGQPHRGVKRTSGPQRGASP